MTEAALYLRNSWYMAAWSDEVSAGMLRRRILGEPILLFRREDGGVAALTDRCPHRFAPLSLGQREGDTVRCAYHGLAFANLDGRDFWSAKPAFLGIDAGGTRARRLLEQMIAHENRPV